MYEENTALEGYDYFISFAMEDCDTVRKIVEIMENIYNARCWFQLKDSKAEFVDAIMDGIEKSKNFLVFVSPNSANSYFVLNEIHHATQWAQKHSNYNVLPIVLDNEDPELEGKSYKSMKFYLARLNMIFYTKGMSPDELVLKIFAKTNFNLLDEAVKTSLYHSSESENKRLKAQNDLMVEFSKDIFSDIVNEDSLMLDVGCAAGDHIAAQLEKLEYKALLGVDLEEERIEEASRRYNSEKNTFRKCDILSSEFDDLLSDYLDELDERSFDIITISAVLLHIGDPVRLLRTLRRFLKKKGFLIIQDEDDGANLVYPESRFYDLAFRIWQDSKESGDRHCARKIPGYLSSAGYSRVKLAKCGISNVGMNEEQREALWDIYFNHHLWLAAEENMFYHISSANKMLDEYKNLYDENKDEYDRGEVFVQLGFYLFIAQK